MMTLGEKIQLLRKQQGLSQESLAAQLYVSRQAVSKWETDESLPDIEKAVLLSKTLGVSTDYLLCSDAADAFVPHSAGFAPSGEHPGETPVQNSCNAPQKHNALLTLIKKKGYFAGYVIAGYSILLLALMRLAHFMFKTMLQPPEGFEMLITDIPASMKLPLLFTDALSVMALLGILSGLVLASYLKKKPK